MPETSLVAVNGVVGAECAVMKPTGLGTGMPPAVGGT